MGRSPSSDGSGLKKGPWTPEEDRKLVEYIEKNGLGSWRALPKHAGLNRCGKSCRLRWTNYLRPDIKRGKFSEEEEQTILNLHATLGNKWSAIASHLPGRTDNEVKNFWNTRLKKKLIQMGYDPMTHQPRTDIFSGLSHLIALANLKELLDHQLASLQQCLQQQQQQLQPQEALTNYTISTMNSYGIGGLQLLVNNDGSLFSHQMSTDELKNTCVPACSSRPLSSCNDTVQVVTETVALSHGESCPNSPWIFSCSSTTPSTSSNSYVAPPVHGSGISLTNMADNCYASTIWPEILVEDPLFNAIA